MRKLTFRTFFSRFRSGNAVEVQGLNLVERFWSSRWSLLLEICNVSSSSMQLETLFCPDQLYNGQRQRPVPFQQYPKIYQQHQVEEEFHPGRSNHDVWYLFRWSHLHRKYDCWAWWPWWLQVSWRQGHNRQEWRRGSKFLKKLRRTYRPVYHKESWRQRICWGGSSWDRRFRLFHSVNTRWGWIFYYRTTWVWGRSRCRADSREAGIRDLVQCIYKSKSCYSWRLGRVWG